MDNNEQSTTQTLTVTEILKGSDYSLTIFPDQEVKAIKPCVSSACVSRRCLPPEPRSGRKVLATPLPRKQFLQDDIVCTLVQIDTDAFHGISG